MKRAIEESFPIVDINRLAERERHGFMPIYEMHKWFARRASSVFRAILIAATKEPGTDIMAEFYRNHTHDPDTNGLVVLDPFMGGGTTVVEALRLGCQVIGIDLNPVAWFVVKAQITPVDPKALKDAVDRLARQPVAWSGKPLKETLLDQYRTECAQCGGSADVIYTYWVKSAICTNPLCGKQVPLFADYRVAQRAVSVRYWRDVICPECGKRFDWELDAATLIGQQALMVHSSRFSAGQGRSETRWTFSAGTEVECPWCQSRVTPKPPAPDKPGSTPKPKRKKVSLAVLLCPHCGEVWQWRGPLPEEVTCPACQEEPYNPMQGNSVRGGSYICPHCGTRGKVIDSIRRLPTGQLLPVHPYAQEGYCARCAKGGKRLSRDAQVSMFFDDQVIGNDAQGMVGGQLLVRNGGKFYCRITPTDMRHMQEIEEVWANHKEELPYPRSGIPDGQETHRLLEHHYRDWSSLFTSRQLLCLSSLLQAINTEPDQSLRELLLCAFSNALESNNVFTRQRVSRNSPGGTAPGGIFSRHDYQPKATFCEQNVWGTVSGSSTFANRVAILKDGLEYGRFPYDLSYDHKTAKYARVTTGETVVLNTKFELHSADSRTQIPIIGRLADLVISDPPYGGNVNYAELADFFYVWLRLVLRHSYREFSPEYCPKDPEIIENAMRGKSSQDFSKGLAQVFDVCRSALRDDGLLAFTFHHEAIETWEALLRSLFDSGFVVESVYPVRGESDVSLHLMDTSSISYDLIHVCRKRGPASNTERRSWAGVRQEIRRRARREIGEIESGRYGTEPLASTDVNLVLIGKCLELYSRHYGAIYDADGHEVTLHDALKEIRNMVDQLITHDRPLPAELEDIDAESRVYLLTLSGQREIKSDDVHKATRGGVVSPDDLLDAGLMIKGREGRGRSYKVKQPAERFPELIRKFGAQEPAEGRQLLLMPEMAPLPRTYGKALFIDEVHFLMGLVEGGENILPWLERFNADRPRLRAACGYLAQRNRAFEPTLRKILGLIDPLPLFREVS